MDIPIDDDTLKVAKSFCFKNTVKQADECHQNK